MADLKAAIAAITAGGSYAFTAGEVKLGWKHYNDVPEDKFPAYYVAGADEKRKNVTNLHFTSDLETTIVGYVRAASGSDALDVEALAAAISAAVSDVTTAIMADPTRGGNARYTEIGEIKTSKGEFGPVGAFEMLVKCEYRSAFAAP